MNRFLRHCLGAVDFYKDHRSAELADLPITDKATVMSNFARFNRPRITGEDVRTALDAGQEHVRGYVVGRSTGTSGNRGLFVISEAERFAWLGTILAKALPDFPWAKHRLALILPAYGQIFRSAAQTGRMSLRFFDLTLELAAWVGDLRAYAPDIIVAPPKVLRALAESTDIKPRHVFSGAEVLDPLDREVIEARFGIKVREIYMATEGLLGVACKHGTLHLAEDVMFFEWEKHAGSDLVTPIITQFTRTTQIMARYRLNDLLRLSYVPCACGSPLQAVSAIVGREDDVFLLGANGRMVTPDVLRNAVVDSDKRIQDYRIVQTGRNSIKVSLPDYLPFEVGRLALKGVQAALQRLGVERVELALGNDMFVPFDRKLRRVHRAWTP